MGDKAAPTQSQNVTAMTQAMRSLPDMMRLINSQVTPSELARFGATSLVSPGYGNLQTQLYDTSGRELNRIGSEIGRSNQLNNAFSDFLTLMGPGAAATGAVDTLQRGLDPEFYRTRENVSRSLNDRLGGGLNGSETSEIERALNRMNEMQGTLDVPSATTTTANALEYGRAGRSALDSALTQANVFLNTGRSGIDAFKTGTGKTSGANSGESKFLGVTPASNEANALGSNLLGQVGGYGNASAQINANRAGTLEKMGSALPDY